MYVKFAYEIDELNSHTEIYSLYDSDNRSLNLIFEEYFTGDGDNTLELTYFVVPDF